MHIQVNCGDLKAALKTLIKVIPKNNHIPVLDCVLIDATESGLKLTATDIDVTMTVFVEAEDVFVEGSQVIPAKKLFDFVSKVDKKSSITIEENVGNVSIHLSSIFLSLASFRKLDFPCLPVINPIGRIPFWQGFLRGMLSEVIYAVATEKDARVYLRGMCVDIKEDAINFVATDGYRLAMVTREFKSKEVKQFIVPSTFVDIVIKTLSLPPQGKSIELYFDNKYAAIYLDSIKIITRLIDEKYPDYESVIPSETNPCGMVNTKQFLAAVTRGSSVFGKDKRVDVMLAPDGLSVTVTRNDEYFEKIEISNFIGEERGALGFDKKLLIEALKSIYSETILVGFSAEKGHLILRNLEDKVLAVIGRIR